MTPNLPLGGMFCGLQLVADSFLSDRKQFRFPRSKCKRIRKKWRKRPENYRDFPRMVAYQVGNNDCDAPKDVGRTEATSQGGAIWIPPLSPRTRVGWMMPTSREICKLCFGVNRIGFLVPDSVWEEVVPEHVRDSVVCLSCFTELADEKYVEWDRHIEFFPVSFLTHLEMD